MISTTVLLEIHYLGTDINADDLEKKNRSGNTLLNGRQLVDMAKRDLCDYRKAMAFISDKWNVKTNEPIESGTTIDDIIEYVRRRMYLSMNAITIDEEEEEDEKDNEAEKEILIEFMKNKRGKDDWIKNEDDNTNDDKDSNDNENNESDSSLDDSKSNKVMKEEEDDEEVEEKEVKDQKKNGKESKKGKSNEDSDEYNTSNDNDSKSENSTCVSDTFLFQSFFAYSLWGLFASIDKKLPLFLIGKYMHISISLSINY